MIITSRQILRRRKMETDSSFGAEPNESGVKCVQGRKAHNFAHDVFLMGDSADHQLTGSVAIAEQQSVTVLYPSFLPLLSPMTCCN